MEFGRFSKRAFPVHRSHKVPKLKFFGFLLVHIIQRSYYKVAGKNYAGDSYTHTRSKRNKGGSAASIEDYPFMVSIRYAGGHTCGGSILSGNIILTARHCINNVYLNLDLLFVKVEDADINFKGSWHKVTSIIKHETYNEDDKGIGDVALLKIDEPILLNNLTSRTIELFGEQDNVQDYAYGISIGWGVVPTIVPIHDEEQNSSMLGTRIIERYPSKLRAVQLHIGSRNECSDLIPEANLDGQFCTFTLGKDACVGDSGGPFVIDGRQAGIVSWGLGCISNEQIGYFIDVAKYRKWIDEHVKILQES
ncbi:hypothetical protein QAD02_008922 [Eretmocerus hayati]|uniref:Uncharacterized protein n=1 Tax=Eretmocerus hayati TaxID=131215 RepID=A0ACC2NC98_9HYME|nr:hypothetical protein QAD02_008922 [Eretmocerus hayati]